MALTKKKSRPKRTARRELARLLVFAGRQRRSPRSADNDLARSICQTKDKSIAAELVDVLALVLAPENVEAMLTVSMGSKVPERANAWLARPQACAPCIPRSGHIPTFAKAIIDR